MRLAALAQLDLVGASQMSASVSGIGAR